MDREVHKPYMYQTVKCPLVDRGGLMRVKLYPYEEGDDEKYEIFTITSDQPWKPRSYQEGKSAFMAKNVKKEKAHKIIQNVKIEGNDPNYYDPSDNNKPIYGSEVALSLDDQAILTMDEADSEAHVYATKVWHRVKHKELDPVHLQAYLSMKQVAVN